MSRETWLSSVSIAVLTIGCCGLAAQTTGKPDTAVLEARLRQVAATFPGKAGIFARNIETGAEVGIHADQLFPMASTYKVAIMTQVFREVDAGRISLSERVTLKESDKRLGSGLLPYMYTGISPTIHDLLLMMIVVSDNEATDLLINRVGADKVTAMLRELGIKDMRVDRQTLDILKDYIAAADPKLKDVPALDLVKDPGKFEGLSQEQLANAGRAFTDDPRDHTSPHAMGELLTKIYKSEAASDKSCKDMIGIMMDQQHKTRIPLYLENVPIASKSGTIGATTNDVGIVYAGSQHIVVSVYTLKGTPEVSTQQAEEFIGRVAKTIYDYFEDTNPKK